MHRSEFRKHFKATGPAILPVIHVLDAAQTVRNVTTALTEGAQGVFLINHDFEYSRLLPVIAQVRERYPALWLGVNFLAVTGAEAFPVLARLAQEGTAVDAYWADDACIDERAAEQPLAEAIRRTRETCGWPGMYFGGTAFKKQRAVAPADYQTAARIAVNYMDAVTTSGVATGAAPGADKIQVFREGCGDAPLALASGVTPENVHDYAADVDAILVATGINRSRDFYNIEAARLNELIRRSREAALPAARLADA